MTWLAHIGAFPVEEFAPLLWGVTALLAGVRLLLRRMVP